ncbi:MAG: metal-sulfur cluster biosynthesis protein [Thaumarchaeota archaeon 13_1_40CM_2_39_13_2]|nr:MAG: metal-sulfur cluster biosynthesis protein [Thaumarchaeota archaeon 13_1_40CM_2_39_13_2]OLE40375.1 MAG: metal-sulfur cluster biosynthesis protein [Thaumarchaeota archaeon 13_1_20CM_2_39_20]
MAAVTSEKVLDSLKQCMDPEIPINIVDMGLIYGVKIRDDNKVDIKMTMTTRGCPLHDTLVNDVKRYVNKVPGVTDVNIEIVWDPPWTPEKMSDDGKKLINYGKQQTIAPINYETAMPQGKGSLAKQEDGSLVLMNENQQGFMVNQAIVDFWKLCNGQRKITELVDLFAQNVGLQRGQVEKEVLQLIQQLRDGGLISIKESDVSNVQFKK